MADGNQGWKAIGCSCCAGVLLVGVLFAVALFFLTKRLVAYGIASEVKDYIRVVERADIDAGTRQELLDQLEHVRGHARRGDVCFFSWLSSEESLEELVEDGVLTDDEAAAFERELDRLEAEIEPAESAPPREGEPAAPDQPLVHTGQARRAAPSAPAILGSLG
jgi:hypothetical protein